MNTPISDPKTTILDEAKNRIVRLFTYLEKVLSIDDIIERDFRETSPFSWWAANLPSADNLYFRKFKVTEIEDKGEDTEGETDPWFRVQKQEIKTAPDVPEGLVEWVKIDYADPTQQPKAIESIKRKVTFDDDKQRVKEYKDLLRTFNGNLSAISPTLQGWVRVNDRSEPEKIPEQYIEFRFSDDPERVKIFDDYLAHDWKIWQEKALPIHRANKIYEELYALRLMLKNEGDNYELLWGHGLLTWQHLNGSNIYSPVFFTPLLLEFDPIKRVIELVPDPMYRSFCEVTPIYELDNPAEMDLIKWADSFNASPFDLWSLEALKTQGRYITGQLSPDGEDTFTDDTVAEPQSTRRPSFWNAPLILVRKRSTDLWSKYAKKIRLEIEQGKDQSTPFIVDLVGGSDSSKLIAESGNSSKAIPEGELFFPRLWNDEQKRIAEQIDGNYGVVVQGPPGTGKSHTIANLISRFLAQGKTVLVTSQTSKALQVLRGMLPQNIRSLAVSQLGQSAKQDQVLQQSISEISANLSERNTKFSDQKVEEVRKKIKIVRERKATLLNAIRDWVLVDSTGKLPLDGEEITPITAAREIAQNEEACSWFKDTVHYEQSLAIAESDIRDFIALQESVSSADRDLHHSWLPAAAHLPHIEMVVEAFHRFKQRSSEGKLWYRVFHKKDEIPAYFNQDVVSQLIELVEDAKKYLLSFNKEWEKEVFQLCLTNPRELTQWSAALEKMNERITRIRSAKATLLGHVVVCRNRIHSDEALQALDYLKKKISTSGTVSSLTRLMLPKTCKNLIDTCTVDGLKPVTGVAIDLLEKYFEAQKAIDEVAVIWSQIFETIGNSLQFPDIGNGTISPVEVTLESLERILTYEKKFSPLQQVFSGSKQLSHLSFIKNEDLEEFLKILYSYLSLYELENLENTFSEWKDKLNSVDQPLHGVVKLLLEGIDNRDADQWQRAYQSLEEITERHEKSKKLFELGSRLRSVVPLWIAEIEGVVDGGGQYNMPMNMVQAWRLARLRSWLDHLHNRLGIGKLQGELERINKQENDLNAELITTLAWQRQIDRVSNKQRNALMAWSHAMKKYGKGTGKYAHTWLRSAQDALKDAKDAVPVWIMPLHRVAQMFSEPRAGMFDVVIFDEASQCDIRGITVGYLGKKVLVVGDPEQISPAGIFQNQEKVFDLVMRFLHDIPHRESFSTTSSLFDIAALRLPNIIMLVEHFRCVPEIIAFSNLYCYENKIKTLRYPQPKGLLKPALNPVFVAQGYQNTNNKVNEPEAEALVKKLLECLQDPQYAKRPEDGTLELSG